jgi:hypothetical protein
MKKYFFDLVSAQRAEYDYKGHDLPTLDKAFQLAELIAMDLEMAVENQWAGWTIKVRNAQGQQLCAIPVGQPELVAA